MMKKIGIVGGVGPYAGLDLNQKIFDNTITQGQDQDHLEVYLLSRSSDIGDRTTFLKNRHLPNPAAGIFRTIEKLDRIGAEVVGMPCNTAHATPIFSEVSQHMQKANLSCRFLHMIEETYRYLTEWKRIQPSLYQLGLLSTQGTYDVRIYPEFLEKDQTFSVLYPSSQGQQLAHEAVYTIKAHATPPREAQEKLQNTAEGLIQQGAQAILLGCTEIPLAFANQTEIHGVPLIDPTLILARSLIREAAPHLLKPINHSIY